MRGTNFWTGLAGVIVGALLVTALPAIAQDAETNAAPGDPMLVGQTNVVNANTALRGDTASNLVVRNTGDGVPLNLINAGNGKAPMKVDSRRPVRNLNADKLDFKDASDFLLADATAADADRVDGYHANQLIRAAFDSIGDAAESNGPAVTATMAAPEPGILIIGGSIEALGTDDAYGCRLTVNGTVVTGSSRFSRVHSPGGDHTNNSDENCATDGGWAVDAGTHSVALNIVNRDTATLGKASVWVIWVPFDGLSRVPSSLDNPTPADQPNPEGTDDIP